MNFLKFIIKTISGIWSNIFILSLSFILITISFYFSITQFNSLDPKIKHSYNYPQEARTTEKHPDFIKTGMHIKNFIEIDFNENKFEIDAIVWFQFNPNTVSIKTIENFSFDMGIIEKKDKPTVKILNKELFVQYNVRVKFKTRLNFSRFPLDDHKISIILKNEKISPANMILISRHSYLTTAPFLYTADWLKVNHHTRNGTLSSILDIDDKNKSNSYPCIFFTIDFTRTGIRKLLVLFMPLLLIFLLGLFSLLIKLKESISNISRLTIGSLNGLILLRFIIETLSPRVGYFTVIDIVYTTSLSCIFIVFLVEALCLVYIQKMKKRKLTIEKINLNIENLNIFRRFLFNLLLLIVSFSVYFSIYFN